ncbi:hypothetical protein AQ505_02095 [Pedobacter sp. PACM 27299]|uniref:oligosaccharide flippase family protein n=1 Tax=Pedobacter sp. PACM 27299 TaxID=1727164 RepID=UPI000705B5A1|nr:oligosaccharide flippase family protein [Pedobacter sp. PACM 27299]ALL04395.1 hypothetical protein AQ505_02095 [Pedobacter sp. PACM 27299]
MIAIKKYLFRKEVLNFVNYYIFTIINAGIAIISISYLTKHIPPEDYGRIGIFSSILFFMPSLVAFCANGLQAIEIVDLGQEEYLKFRNQYISFVLLNTLFFSALAGLLSFLIPEFSFVIITATLMGLVQTFSNVHNTELFQHSQATRFGLISSATVLLSFLLTFIFISGFKLDWKYRILALLFSEFIIVIFRFYGLSSIGANFKFSLNKSQFKYFLYYGAPLIFSMFAGWVINQSDRFFLLHFFSLREVGIYAAAASIASFIALINGNMSKVIYPVVFQKLNKREGKRFILKITFLYSIIILVITAFFCLGIHLFGGLFLGKKYVDAFPIIYIMCFGQAFFGIYTTTGMVIDYFKKTKLKTMLITIGAVLIIILSFVMTPIIGISGPALAALISFIFLAFGSFVITRNLFNTYKVI